MTKIEQVLSIGCTVTPTDEQLSYFTSGVKYLIQEETDGNFYTNDDDGDRSIVRLDYFEVTEAPSPEYYESIKKRDAMLENIRKELGELCSFCSEKGFFDEYMLLDTQSEINEWNDSTC